MNDKLRFHEAAQYLPYGQQKRKGKHAVRGGDDTPDFVLFPLEKNTFPGHGAAMVEKPDARSERPSGKASSQARKVRLEKALRDNLKRRKDQARRQTETRKQR